MNASFFLLLLLSFCVLRATCQVRQGATVLRDSCPLVSDVANQTMEPSVSSVLSNVATRIASGRGTCLDKIYVMAYTSGGFYDGSNNAHEIEVVGHGQKRKIALPERPDDYTLHKGDIWKMDIVEDLGFLPGTCLRLCNIQNVTIEEEGSDGWRIDSIMTYGCVDGLGCSPLTQDIDVFRWVDGDDAVIHRRFPLTKVSQTLCI